MASVPQIKGNRIFAPLKNCWLVYKPEEEVRQNYILRLIEVRARVLKRSQKLEKHSSIFSPFSVILSSNI